LEEKMKGSQKHGKNKLNHRWMTFPIAFLFFIGGCGGGTPPSSLPPEKAKSSAVEKRKEDVAKMAEKKEPEKKEETEFSYNPTGKPDPFKPFIQLTPVREGSRNVPLTPLQKFEISQLKLVAIISLPGENIALVEDATGKGYFVKKGTLIGKNDGKVKKILKDTVIIEEIYQDVFGQTKTSEISLSLHKAEGGES
jgi:type IV pilus assembly protein PilP